MDRLVTRSLVFCWAPAIVVLLCTGTAHAQAVKGGLLGTIVDQSGFALPGVTLTITEVNTNVSYSAVTNNSGNYVFSNLKDGKYRVSAELSGFKRVVREGVDVPVNATPRVGHRRGREPAAANRPRRHQPHHRKRPSGGGAARLQPQLPGDDDHRAGRLEDATAALRLLQRAGQPVGERQRSVAPGEQRADRGDRRQSPHGTRPDWKRSSIRVRKTCRL